MCLKCFEQQCKKMSVCFINRKWIISGTCTLAADDNSC